MLYQDDDLGFKMVGAEGGGKEGDLAYCMETIVSEQPQAPREATTTNTP